MAMVLSVRVFWSGRWADVVGFEGLGAEHVHAVGGAGAGHDDSRATWLGVATLAPSEETK